MRSIASDQLDKGSSQFGREGRRRSPHSCLQECLNADDNANWGLLLTGDRLRLLHDNPSLVKPAYLAVDLELLVEGELFTEFAVLWLLLHASRFRHPQTGSCVLDTWKEQSQEAGERVLGQLRNGVQQALEALGNGLLQHPDNEALRNQLASGALSGQELHRQLLRLVYRFLFLFTAEDRAVAGEGDRHDRRRDTQAADQACPRHLSRGSAALDGAARQGMAYSQSRAVAGVAAISRKGVGDRGKGQSCRDTNWR